MADNYGLTDAGFVPMQQPEVLADLQQRVRLQFGNVDLSDQSVFGQLLGIMSASSAQLWQAAAALYSSSYPDGATGVSVDNILALNNLQRLPEAASTTNNTPVTRSDGVVLYGLRLLGIPGTVVPAGTLVSNGAPTPIKFSTDQAVTITAGNNARQRLFFGNVPDRGSYTLTLTTSAGAQGTTQAIPYNAMARATYVGWSKAPTSSYTLVFDGVATDPIDPASNAQAVQQKVNNIAVAGSAQVSGSTSAGFTITWQQGYVPQVSSAGTSPATNIVQATSALVHATTINGVRPFTDVLLTDSQQALTLDYGAFAPQTGCPTNQYQSMPRVAVGTTTLYQGQVGTSIGPQTIVVGNPAQAVASATCTKTGAYSVLAGQLTTISTPVSGLNKATNDLDCLIGRTVESDSDAIARFKALQGSSSSGSLGAITKRVQQVAGVQQVVAFQNTSNAAGQVLQFATTPTSGQFSLVVGGNITELYPYNVSAAAMQASLRNISGLSQVLVTAYGDAGYAFDFAGVRGGQGLSLISVSQNSTQVPLTAYFARPPHSVEIVVEGGSEQDLTAAILEALPAGVATYSNPSLRTTATLTANQAQVPVASTAGVSVGQTVEASGIALGTRVVSIGSGAVTLSSAALSSGSLVPIAFTYAPVVKDAAGNAVSVGFSRPQSVLIYVVLQLVTDSHISPGDVNSGINSGALFDPSSTAGIAENLQDIINAVPIGGTIYARGTNGLGGSFRSTPGIVDYNLYFGTSPSPTNTSNLAMQSNQAPTAQSYSIVVSYT